MNELTINLDSRSKKPLYEQIYDYIKSDIQNGRIPYGEKLPSTRALAKHLEVSRSTVELAYEQLLSEGYIESAPYRGFFVAQIDELYQLKKEEKKSERKIEKKKVYQYDFFFYTVEIANNIIRQYLMSAKELHTSVHTDDILILFFFKNR